MKPRAQHRDRRKRWDSFCRPGPRQFPTTDCNYQIYSLDRFRGGPTGTPPASFLNISREYFRYEARRNFIAEVAFFLILVAILAGAFLSGARAIIHFLHLPAA